MGSLGSRPCVSQGSRPVTTPSTAWWPGTSTSSGSLPTTASSWSSPATRCTSASSPPRPSTGSPTSGCWRRSSRAARWSAIGRNYAAHAAEMGNEVPDEPLMFLKPNTSVVGPGDPIRTRARPRTCTSRASSRSSSGGSAATSRRSRPPTSSTATRSATTSPRATCSAATCSSPAPRASTRSARSARGSRPTSTRRTRRRLRLQTHLNGDLKQDGSTADLIFDIPTLVAHITSVMTLLPGDVILTGTPEGVGPMEVGDEVEVSIARHRQPHEQGRVP